MKRLIETDRLYLREFMPKDSEFLFMLKNDNKVLKCTGDDPFKDSNDALNFSNNYKDYEVNGFGRWVVINKNKEEPIDGMEYNSMKKKILQSLHTSE